MSVPDLDTTLFVVNPERPNRELRRRGSLKHAFNFTLSTPVPAPHEVEEAGFIYLTIVGDCEAAGIYLQTPGAEQEEDYGQVLPADYDCHADDTFDDAPRGVVYVHSFFCALYQHSPTVPGRVNLVRIILHGLFSPELTAAADRSLEAILPFARLWTSFSLSQRQHTFDTLATVAVEFLVGFFAPLSAKAHYTLSASTIITPSTHFNASPS